MLGFFQHPQGVQLFSSVGAFIGFLGVAAGAFGGHALKNILTQEMLAIYEIGVRYQMYHALALFGSAWACSLFSSSLCVASGWCFIAGILLFSGSLYVLAITGIRAVGMITPLGGIAFLVGWLGLSYLVLKG